ncbi:MAG: hypothetical protein ACK55I_32870, partial [bacterium]
PGPLQPKGRGQQHQRPAAPGHRQPAARQQRQGDPQQDGHHQGCERVEEPAGGSEKLAEAVGA